jgi:hypothetical protein
MDPFKLDRTAFKHQTVEEAAHQFHYWQTKSYADRLRAANYLNSVAYNYDLNNPPKLDRAFFHIRKRS